MRALLLLAIALLGLASSACDDAFAGRLRRSNVRSRGSLNRSPGNCINPLTGGLNWDVRFEGKDADATTAGVSVWPDAEGTSADLVYTVEGGSAAMATGQSTGDFQFCDSAYVDSYVKNNGNPSAYYLKPTSAGFPDYANGTSVHLRIIFQYNTIHANDAAYVAYDNSDSGIALLTTSTTNLRVYFFAGDSIGHQCNYTIAAATDYYLDVLYTDTGLSSATITAWLNGTAQTVCNTTQPAVGMSGSVYQSIFSSATNNEAEDMQILFVGVRADTGEISETVHDRDCTFLGICS